MPSYNLYTCPNCEDHFRLIWPDPVQIHIFIVAVRSKIKCPLCVSQRTLR